MGTIICAVAETPEAEEALRAAVALSQAGQLRLVLVRVEERGRNGSAERAMRRGKELLEREIAAQRVPQPVDTRVEFGDRAAALARTAAEEAAGVIVLGSPHRRRWRRRPATGLHDVLAAMTRCPIAVIPPPPRE